MKITITHRNGKKQMRINGKFVSAKIQEKIIRLLEVITEFRYYNDINFTGQTTHYSYYDASKQINYSYDYKDGYIFTEQYTLISL